MQSIPYRGQPANSDSYPFPPVPHHPKPPADFPSSIVQYADSPRRQFQHSPRPKNGRKRQFPAVPIRSHPPTFGHIRPSRLSKTECRVTVSTRRKIGVTNGDGFQSENRLLYVAGPVSCSPRSLLELSVWHTAGRAEASQVVSRPRPCDLPHREPTTGPRARNARGASPSRVPKPLDRNTRSRAAAFSFPGILTHAMVSLWFTQEEHHAGGI
jgi:hypothetical protein